MRPRRIAPARIVFSEDGGPPRAADFDDVYHARVGAAAQAAHVFLGGAGLPRRWAGRTAFAVLETGFGLGSNFLATWAAWRADPERPRRLVHVSIEGHPLTREQLARAHAGSPWPGLAAELIAAWPVLTPDLHVITFDGGAVELQLALGDAAGWLPALALEADAVFLDGFAPAANPAMWSPELLKAVGARAAAGCVAATWCVAGEVRAALRTAGFEPQRRPGIGGKREVLCAPYRPRPGQRRQRAACGPEDRPRDAIVVGAGIAGASLARELARAGLEVTVLDAVAPAAGASGNPAGLFHGALHPDDGPHARLHRAAALHAARVYREAFATGAAQGECRGLLRCDGRAGGAEGMRTLLESQALPAGYVQVLDAAAASAVAGVALESPAWFYPEGGWIAPRSWIAHALATPGVRTACGEAVARVHRSAERPGAWVASSGGGRVLAQAGVLVFAHAGPAAPLLAHDEPALAAACRWPLAASRGQVSHWPANSALRLPVAGAGYVLPMPGELLAGATRDPGVPVTDGAALPLAELREADHAHNLQRVLRLSGIAPPGDGALQGRAGWRLQTPDRMPIAGALPAAGNGAADVPERPRALARWPREPGLFVLTALGSRGLTLAPLLARLVAAQACGEPLPLPRELLDAVDPARWLERETRPSRR